MQDLPEASAARFACGLLAGLTAKMATHPLDVAKKRFQVRLRSALKHIALSGRFQRSESIDLSLFSR